MNQGNGLSDLCPNPINFEKCPTFEVKVAPQATYPQNISNAILLHVYMLRSVFLDIQAPFWHSSPPKKQVFINQCKIPCSIENLQQEYNPDQMPRQLLYMLPYL